MKRLVCWWRGHDYVLGYGRRIENFILSRPDGEILSVTLCVYCGARLVQPKKEML